jgi:hypothetical protein
MFENRAVHDRAIQAEAEASKPSARLGMMPSSVIYRFNYDPRTAQLEIIFTTGRRYLYAQVPQHVVDEFRAAFSKGAFFNRYIRDRYECREVDPISG